MCGVGNVAKKAFCKGIRSAAGIRDNTGGGVESKEKEDFALWME